MQTFSRLGYADVGTKLNQTYNLSTVRMLGRAQCHQPRDHTAVVLSVRSASTRFMTSTSHLHKYRTL